MKAYKNKQQFHNSLDRAHVLFASFGHLKSRTGLTIYISKIYVWYFPYTCSLIHFYSVRDNDIL